jgi:hypothetical protein
MVNYLNQLTFAVSRMAYLRVTILVDDKDYQQLHELMNLAIVGEDGRIKEKMFEGGYQQEWYRRVLRKGMNTMLSEFELLKKKYETEQ